MKKHDPIGVRRRQDRERGQATTEFALILFPLLILVAGIIQFGIALNFWLDEQRIANQGARWAVVNSWPGCPRTEPVPLMGSNCTGANTLEEYLHDQALSQGLRNSVLVDICYPDDGDPNNDGRVGSPVQVTLNAPFKFVPILELGMINLRGRATMRLEQNTNPALAFGHLTGVGGC